MQPLETSRHICLRRLWPQHFPLEKVGPLFAYCLHLLSLRDHPNSTSQPWAWKEGEILENTESVAEKARDGDLAPSTRRVTRLEGSWEAPPDHCFKWFGVYKERRAVGKSLSCPPSPSCCPYSFVHLSICKVPPRGHSGHFSSVRGFVGGQLCHPCNQGGTPSMSSLPSRF